MDPADLARVLRPAVGGRVLALTGAGISADSGIPTFRDAGGYWRRHNPRRLATRRAFRADPATVWAWYASRRRTIRAAKPNAAHRALARLARRSREFLLVTQNVDDLHERGGIPRRQLVHIHGRIFRDRCPGCGFTRSSRVAPARPPECPKCRARLRPDVIWFDEDLHEREVARVDRFLADGPCDLVLVIGTMATFGYIVEWVRRGGRGKATVVEINPAPSRVSRLATVIFRGRAADVLPDLVARASKP